MKLAYRKISVEIREKQKFQFKVKVDVFLFVSKMDGEIGCI